MTYSYNYDCCFNENSTDHLSKTNSLNEIKANIALIFQNNFNQTHSQTEFYKIFHPINPEEEIKPLQDFAGRISSSYKQLVIIGMGGAFLNPQAVLSLREENANPKVHFLSNTDPQTFSQVINSIDLNDTFCLVISKSGETLETIALTGAMIAKYGALNLDIEKYFAFITGKENSTLRQIASKLQCPIFDHKTDISGRFSGFSNVTILPGLICGLDMQNFLEGGNSTVKDFWDNKENSKPAQSAAAIFKTNLPIHINLSYFSKLIPFLELNRQLIAESLGKNNKGFMPAFGLGSNDQHSILQLYLDGPKDKLFTIYHIDNHAKDSTQFSVDPIIGVDYLVNKTLQDINISEYVATKNTLKQNNLNVREIVLNKFDEKNLGALVMHTYIETIILGILMQINPFDQPHVEQIKLEAKKILSKKLL